MEKIILVLASVVGFTLDVQSQVINVQFGPLANSDGQSANSSMLGYTGPSADTGTVWNAFTTPLSYNGASASDAALVNSLGNATGVTLTFDAPQGNATPGSDSSSLPIFRSGVYLQGADITFTLLGLSSGSLYDLYAISGGTPDGIYAGTFQVSGAVVSSTQSATLSGSYTSFTLGDNTVLFSDIAPTTDGQLTLTLSGSTYSSASGFQLVDVSDAPEPTAWALLGLSGLMAARTRRTS